MPRSVKDVATTLLFAVVAVVSAVALLKTAASPFAGGSFGPAQWALFMVTLIGSTCAFLRSLRYWASVSVLSRRRSTRAEEMPEPERVATPRARMHPVLDDLTWATLALAILAINVLAVSAVVVTLRELFGDSATPVGWLIWQLALLTAAAAGLGRLSGAVAAELRDRSRRRRRNAVHVVTDKLMHWPGESSSAGRRGRQVATVAATAALASVALANAAGPLLEPGRERAQLLAGQAGEREGTAAHPAGSQSPAAPPAATKARSAAAAIKAELARRSTRRRAEQDRLSRDTTAEQPVVVPEAPAPPPPSAAAPVAPQPTPGANERATSERRRAHKRRAGERRRHSDGRRRRTKPQPEPPADTSPRPTTPAPSPPGTPCDPAGDPAAQPPCGNGQGARPPE